MEALAARSSVIHNRFFVHINERGIFVVKHESVEQAVLHVGWGYWELGRRGT